MLEWTIIGGGIQGCTLATYLLRTGKTSVDRMAVVDPHSDPLHQWFRLTEILKMPFLRSPAVHHIDVDPFALRKYAQSPQGWAWSTFTFPQERPSLELFNRHCLHVLESIQLKESWVKGQAAGLARRKSGWRVLLKDGREIDSQRVVLAMGLSERPFWPKWSQSLKRQGASVFHLFSSPSPDLTELPTPVTIIGGGISAAHAAIRLSKLYPAETRLITRHCLRIHQFDSDPGWLGPKNMRSFQQINDYQQRRNLIQKARHRGSMPSDVHAELKQAEQKGRLDIYTEEVYSATFNKKRIHLYAKEKNNLPETGSIILATGFHTSPPGMEWLKPTVEKWSLQCHHCGYPILSPHLEWAPGLSVTGCLAELELGPVSRNIAGARRGAERILRANEVEPD
ncbi:FAD/NAD(P)-binding protein [Desmospora profundinema]|uniref:Thioredoxin reductase n=1 Tax=Desmospora profundinema TaxID=1571184 RepID=A0ABU1IR61_9BACL|nr:FAD/NAD(P)-binding protein [Desmospora profundinema]MDR6227278.1 thioredoxin reductase [Desmospora profundinema]